MYFSEVDREVREFSQLGSLSREQKNLLISIEGTRPHASRGIQRTLRWFTWALPIGTAISALCRTSWIYPVMFTFPVNESAVKVFTMNLWVASALEDGHELAIRQSSDND